MSRLVSFLMLLSFMMVVVNTMPEWGGVGWKKRGGRRNPFHDPMVHKTRRGCRAQDIYTETIDEMETTAIMLREQSRFLRKLKGKDQVLYEMASKRNGLSHQSPRCKLKILVACNQNQAKMDKCLTVKQDFPRCLHKTCRGCGSDLVSLLGFDPCHKRMDRLILRKKGTNEFGNLLSTPYVLKNDSVFKSHLYLDHDGVLRPEDSHEKMRFKLQEHKSYWEDKLGSFIALAAENPKEMDMVKTTIESADKLVDVINKTKTIVLGDVEKKLKAINTEIAGIKEESKKNLKDSLILLYTSEVRVHKTQSILESLAKETINRVNSMLYYLDKVHDEWEAEKIAKFMKFQAKKMTELIERSLEMIKKAEDLYMDVGIKLGEIQGKLEAFGKDCKNLADSESAAYKARVKDMRLKVYLPCCLLYPYGCPICIGVLENEINKWKGELNELRSLLKNNVAQVTTIADNAKKQREKLRKEVKSLLNWSSALHVMSEVDYTFPEAEIFGFADVRPELQMNLNNLKEAASAYLKINANKTS